MDHAGPRDQQDPPANKGCKDLEVSQEIPDRRVKQAVVDPLVSQVLKESKALLAKMERLDL